MGLQPGVTYTFAIEAHTKIGAGLPKRIHKKMPIRAPPTPGEGVAPSEISRTSSTIKIRFRDNYFSNKNGEVKKYTIIVAEDKDFESTPKPEQPRSWADVQSYSRWPAYMVHIKLFHFHLKSHHFVAF